MSRDISKKIVIVAVALLVFAVVAILISLHGTRRNPIAIIIRAPTQPLGRRSEAPFCHYQSVCVSDCLDDANSRVPRWLRMDDCPDPAYPLWRRNACAACQF